MLRGCQRYWVELMADQITINEIEDEGPEKLMDVLADRHGEENLNTNAGGVTVSADCDCDRCTGSGEA